MLYNILGSRPVIEEVLRTTLCLVEQALNSRTITPVSTNSYSHSNFSKQDFMASRICQLNSKTLLGLTLTNCENNFAYLDDIMIVTSNPKPHFNWTTCHKLSFALIPSNNPKPHFTWTTCHKLSFAFTWENFEYKKRYVQAQSYANSIWSRWLREYVSLLIKLVKLHTQSNLTLETGNFV